MPVFWKDAYPPGYNYSIGRLAGTDTSGDIYVLALESQDSSTQPDYEPYVWKSTDAGVSFTRQSSVSLWDKISSTETPAMEMDGDNVIGFINDSSTFSAVKFDTSTNTWGTVSSLPVVAFCYSSAIARKDSTHIGVLVFSATERVKGNYYNRVGLVELNPSTMTWGTPVTVSLSGAESNDAIRSNLCVDSSGNYHMILLINGSYGHWSYNGSTFSGPHNINSNLVASHYNTFTCETIGSTDTLFLPGKNSSNYAILTKSTDGGSTWSLEHTANSSYEPSSTDNYHQSVLVDSSDTIYWVVAYDVYVDNVNRWSFDEYSKTTGGSWSNTVVSALGPDEWNISEKSIDTVWTDESSGHWGTLLSAWNFDAGSVRGQAFNSPYGKQVRTLSHTSDMRLSLIGVKNGIYWPSGANPNFADWFAMWGLDETDTSKLIGHIYKTVYPEMVDDVYGQTTATINYDFVSDIKCIENTWQNEMLVQLANGEIWGFQYNIGRIRTSSSSTNYWNDWAREQQNWIVGPERTPKKIRDAYTTTAFNLRGMRYYENFAFIYNGPQVGGIDKVYYSDLLRDSAESTWAWGNIQGSSVIYPLHNMWASPEQQIDPDNTTEDEYAVGIFSASGGGDLNEPRGTVLYTREGATKTYLYEQEIALNASQTHFEIWSDATSGSFTLKIPSNTTSSTSSSIAYNESASSLSTILLAMDEVSSVYSSSGSGSKSDPWIIHYNAFNYPYVASSTLDSPLHIGLRAFDPIQLVEVKHQTIPKLVYWQGHDYPIIVYVQPNGKIGMLITKRKPQSWRTAESDYVTGYETYVAYYNDWGGWGQDRPVLWEVLDTDISDGTVYVHNKRIAADVWIMEYERENDDDWSSANDTIYWFVVIYIDGTTQDLKMAARAWRVNVVI